MRLLSDQRLKTVKWKDLTRLSFREMTIENTVTIPWLLISVTLACFHYYLIALPFSFMLFLTGLRQVHNGFHHTLGTNKGLTQLTLFCNSVMMLAAMHAVEYNHLRHHKYCLQEDDEEGKCARMPAWKALLYGPTFIYRQHAAALRSGNTHTKKAVLLELTAIAGFVILAFGWHIAFLEYHILAMGTGELFTAFFAVWTVHHDCDENIYARTVSSRWKNKLTYNMFYHLEHHLYPGVPTIKLPELSQRIRTAAPDLKPKEVF